MSLRFLIALFLLSTTVLAQGTLKGIILETGSNQPLTGAHIVISDIGIGATANPDGSFIFPSIKAGIYQMNVSFVGYTNITQTIEVGEKTSTELKIYLEPGSIQLADVVISSNADRPLNTLSSLDIKLRPTNTSQDILRMVPGLFIAQHAGGGKAEQIFLRGFDIDHGTDINLEVDGLPVNMVSHAHGQGYSDLHFLIPELIQYVDFDKGPYFADKGDFTTAGYVDFQTKNSLDKNFFKIEGGQFGSVRAVTGINFIPKQSMKQTGYIASEFLRSDGYFESPQNFKRFNIASKYSIQVNEASKLSFGASFFNSHWNASGQIPKRAVKSGSISRFGSIDDTEGGVTERINIYSKYIHQFASGATIDQQAYAVRYTFNLFSNFTFYLNDSVNGDQIQQKESRMIYGYKINYNSSNHFVGKKLTTHVGGGLRYDDVADIALSNTVKRKFLSDVQQGDLQETNINGFISETLELNNQWSVNAALRFDYFIFSYNNKLSQVTGRKNASIVSPKISVQYQLSDNTQLYLRMGTGFHSNDGRVVVNQKTKTLPRAYGLDLGINTKIYETLFLHAALWRLDLDQEFVYVGDAGIVEPSGKTQRMGIDLSVRYQILPWLFADADLSWANPKIKNAKESEAQIPLAPKFSSIAGLSVRTKTGVNGSLRYRYLADRSANEISTVVADGYWLMDGVVSYTRRKFEIGLSIENIFNISWNEAQFDTQSRLLQETEPISEIHFTPGTPFSAKLKVSFFF